MSHKDELTIPEAAKRDDSSFELARIWIANKGQHVSLKVGVWEDPAAWGILLADLARHVANSYEQADGYNSTKALQRVKAGFDAELSSSTDTPTGYVGNT